MVTRKITFNFLALNDHLGITNFDLIVDDLYYLYFKLPDIYSPFTNEEKKRTYMTSAATFLNDIFWVQMIYEVRSSAFETI